VSAEVLWRPVRELGELLRSRKVRAVELAELYLDRLERIGPRYNAVVTVMRDHALGQARRADAEIASGRWRGPLHGIPYGAKDLLATAGAPTTWGAAPYREQHFDFDATVIRKLEVAGAVLCAKLAMIELAGGMGYRQPNASFTGPCINPWAPDAWSGGSSSGSGAAVASGLVPFAIGSETWGSILSPAGYCGLAGLRPTYGRVSRHGAMALCWTLDKLGPMARGADDCALVLAAMAGKDPRDESTASETFTWSAAPARPARARLAVPKGCTEKVQPPVRENFEKALEVLAPIATITRDVEWPDFPWGPAVGTIVNAEGATAFYELLDSGKVTELTCPADKSGGYSGLLTPAVDYLQAMRLRRPMKRAVAKVFESYEAVISPTRATVAYPADKNFGDAYPGISGGPALIPAGNLCGLPALAMPNGYGDNGLPTSFALMGPAFSEKRLAEVGAWYQRQTDWHLRRPPDA